jgi:hypothetical protein
LCYKVQAARRDALADWRWGADAALCGVAERAAIPLGEGGFMAANVPGGSPARQPWPWPDSLDALIAAPDHHRLLLENEQVRVLETRIPPGDTVPLHTHCWPAIFHVIRSSDFIRRDGDGKVLVDTRAHPSPEPAPQVVWSEALPPHTLENVGAGEIHLISIELKHAGF